MKNFFNEINDDISVIEGNKKELIVFMSSEDMSSFLQLLQLNKQINNRTLITLNSDSNSKKFLNGYKKYDGKMFLCLSGDRTGNAITRKILSEFHRKNIKDVRQLYGISENKNQNGGLSEVSENSTNNAELDALISKYKGQKLNNDQVVEAVSAACFVSDNHKINLKENLSITDDSNADYWKKELLSYQKTIDLHKAQVQEVIENLAQKGIDVTQIEYQTKTTEDKIAELDKELEKLPETKENLIAKYKIEKQNHSNNFKTDFKSERAAENKIIFKLDMEASFTSQKPENLSIYSDLMREEENYENSYPGKRR
ncbi:hypothetical protein [Chryseobacterium sp. FH1]|uniref:hypothetical protein n=1 Tax=Chryseobacterium sp. FH1 TaxID=1233951 RepID=UPI0004E2F511|nr:hypothetical protein [Chryseobacterium sp. FH1]KFC20721.1 hypothetical protein IO90_16440 [Chryseobacterium sp. FH1]